MFDKLFSIFKETTTPKQRLKTVIKVTCKDFDNLTGNVEIKESDVGTSYTYFKCPLCMTLMQIPSNIIEKESPVHTSEHVVLLLEGEIRPARL